MMTYVLLDAYDDAERGADWILEDMRLGGISPVQALLQADADAALATMDGAEDAREEAAYVAAYGEKLRAIVGYAVSAWIANGGRHV